mmetsp:Transcript_9667/g.29377  ORF Transcript_9667/g.29377 Transcript_9667/m.29377 type:complete len:90 (+) Transcript_9667:130-399(+)
MAVSSSGRLVREGSAQEEAKASTAVDRPRSSTSGDVRLRVPTEASPHALERFRAGRVNADRQLQVAQTTAEWTTPQCHRLHGPPKNYKA